ncbi:DMT family transporter [Arenibacter troitsensis]|uniref:Threonine/homoserine efflux transporter RhtA n=1 Tax=Arenibacter troitsensis TaxID=188872 RepID=A0A1X7JIA0_9FLAO|nr:EamA family transporter [Arenibacter troitsensis]SMG27448.1 Threonine/homoserine efflux transporter RhtA [Arenibacter troitsensis]
MKSKSLHINHLLEINLAMIFISTSGALGRYVQLPVPVTIASRAGLAFLFLLLYCKWKKISFRIAKKDHPILFLSGIFMGVHWLTYFYALQLSSVAIGMLSMFTYPIITALLEPLILKTPFQRIHFVLGLLVLAGIYLLAPDFETGNSNIIAVGLGVFSALAYAIRNIILKSRAAHYNGSLMMTYQTGIVGFILAPVFFIYNVDAIADQWPALLTLALFTTAIGHTLFLNCFKHFSITTVSILSSVQPVYGILIGVVFLSEIPSWTTVMGGILILSSVVIESVRSYK